jgi:aspartate aminotransferase
MRMNPRVADRLNALSESQTLAMARMSRELQAKGIDVISLSIGEPDYDTPDFIKQAAKDAIDQNFTHYPPVPGFQDLRDAVCAKLKRDNSLEYKASEIVISTGAKQSIANVILSLINPGDEVIVPIPYWVSYLELIKLAGGIPVFISASIDDKFKISAEQLEAAITPRTRMFMINSPSNPSGAVYNQSELAALAAVLGKHADVLVLSDEIYELINFEGSHASLASFQNLKDRTIIVNGVSKGFAMTGWRIGYIAAPEWIAKACEKMQGQFTSGTGTISQKAAVAALLTSPEQVKWMKDGFIERRNLVLGMLRKIPGLRTEEPEGAFYVFPDVSALYGKHFEGKTIHNSTDLCMYLLEKARVALVPGIAFGDDRCIRISYATSPDRLRAALLRVHEAITALQDS